MRAAVALALCSLAAPANGAWLRLAVPGIEVYTDAGAGTGRQALRKLEEIRQVFPAGGTRPARPLRIYIFDAAREFERVEPGRRTAGFYQSGVEADLIVTHRGAGIGRVVVHEYIHYVIHQGDAPLPLWLEEGLAELYSNIEISRGRARVGEPIAESIAQLERQLLPASALLRPPQQEGGLYYAQTWALAHMLSLAPDYRGGMPRFAAALAGGTGEAQAFADAFGKSFEQAVADLGAYLRTLRAVTIDAPAAATDPPQERIVSTAEGLLLRANLALETGRIDTARPLIEQAAREFPSFPGTATGLGALAFADGDRETARKYFERAVGLDPRDGSAWFQLALLEQSQTGGADRVKELLERAVSLNPNLAEAHLLLGVRATDEGALGPAVDHLRQAARLLPRQSHVWHALAFALQKQGITGEARDAARRALRTAATPEQIGMAEALLRSLL